LHPERQFQLLPGDQSVLDEEVAELGLGLPHLLSADLVQLPEGDVAALNEKLTEKFVQPISPWYFKKALLS
jgi:hypothetical protein